MEWIPNVLVVIGSGALLIMVLKNTNNRVDKKVDISVCNERWQAVCKELSRGEKSFETLRSDISLMYREQEKTNSALSLITQKIDIYLKSSGISQ